MKRYDFIGFDSNQIEDPRGDFVEYDDAEREIVALRARLAEVERELLGTSEECDRQRERAKRAERTVEDVTHERDDAQRVVEG